MLLKMDERISAAIDMMVAQRIKGGPEIFIGNSFDFERSWIGEIYKVSGEFASLADPDALEIIPGLAEVFDRKKAEVIGMNLPEGLRDSILLEISSRRRLVGIDKRLRDLNKGRVSSESADVW